MRQTPTRVPHSRPHRGTPVPGGSHSPSHAHGEPGEHRHGRAGRKVRLGRIRHGQQRLRFNARGGAHGGGRQARARASDRPAARHTEAGDARITVESTSRGDGHRGHTRSAGGGDGVAHSRRRHTAQGVLGARRGAAPTQRAGGGRVPLQTGNARGTGGDRGSPSRWHTEELSESPNTRWQRQLGCIPRQRSVRGIHCTHCKCVVLLTTTGSAAAASSAWTPS